jgi:mediator of RNA polymerase II transcription subunit 14
MFTKVPIPTSDLRLSRSFFDNLAKYGEKLMSEINGVRELHRERVPQSVELSSPSELNVSRMCVQLSDILPPRSRASCSAYRPWAKEYVPIVFRGLGPLPLEDQEITAGANLLQRQETRSGGIIKEATLAVTDRRKFQFLKGNLDRDVLYDPQIGQFTFRLRLESGASGISLLRTRIQSLQRLIDFVEAIRRAGKGAVPESATLREVVFTYSNNTPNGLLGDAQEHRSWRVRLDLASEQGVNFILEKGNPHLRVIDYLRDAANSPKFEALPAWLILTLPLYRALERVEDSWAKPLATGGGSCYVFQKSLDWVTIRFALPGSNQRRVNLDIKPRERNGDLKWYISRAPSDPHANNENEEFNKVLKQRVWTISGNGFKGLTTGAWANQDVGIENLLALINESMLSMVGTPPPPQLQQPQQPLPQSSQLTQDQQTIPPQGPPAQQGPPARFPHQHLQQRPQQSHMPQPNMNNQGQHQGQRPGLGKNNTPVVVLD